MLGHAKLGQNKKFPRNPNWNSNLSSPSLSGPWVPDSFNPSDKDNLIQSLLKYRYKTQ
jgi:hypothetical protein